jgi:hypothetical protein
MKVVPKLVSVSHRTSNPFSVCLASVGPKQVRDDIGNKIALPFQSSEVPDLKNLTIKP